VNKLRRIVRLTPLVAVCAAAAGANEPPAGKCATAAKAMYGVAALEVGSEGVREPKRTRYLRPEFPTKWPEACRSTHFTHEFLIGLDGKVARVWTVRASCREIDEIIAAAIRGWQYEPTAVKGAPVPVCGMAQTIVDLR
jgi:hypothetical protein